MQTHQPSIDIKKQAELLNSIIKHREEVETLQCRIKNVATASTLNIECHVVVDKNKRGSFYVGITKAQLTESLNRELQQTIKKLEQLEHSYK
mgnify:CR=1 FL=1